MRIRTIYRYIYILGLSTAALGMCVPAYAQAGAAQTDTVAEESDPPERKKYDPGHQLAIGVDVFRPVLNTRISNKYTYEGEAYYYLKNEYFLAAEGGWGGSEVSYPDLAYTTTNYFARLGFNKSILYRESEHDWDMMFMGLRIAGGNVSRSPGTYIVTDSLWGSMSGVSPAKNFKVIWTEITLGMRVELVRGLLAGWNLRGKFLMNGKSFRDLQPLHIAGYGKGDKGSVFDMNVYLDYAIRWGRKSVKK